MGLIKVRFRVGELQKGSKGEASYVAGTPGAGALSLLKSSRLYSRSPGKASGLESDIEHQKPIYLRAYFKKS